MLKFALCSQHLTPSHPQVSLTPPLQSGDIFTNISSPPNGTTPPREFFVSVLDPNNCQVHVVLGAPAGSWGGTLVGGWGQRP